MDKDEPKDLTIKIINNNVKGKAKTVKPEIKEG